MKGADPMPFSGNAVLQDEDGRLALQFERVLNHPIERVWTALTEPGDLRCWHPPPGRFRWGRLERHAGAARALLSPRQLFLRVTSPWSAYRLASRSGRSSSKLSAHRWSEHCAPKHTVIHPRSAAASRF